MLLATWTLVYHLCLVLRIGTTTAVVLEVAALVAAVLWPGGHGRRRRRPAAVEEPAHPTGRGDRAAPAASGILRVLGALTLILAVVGAVATGLDAPWVLTWLPWLGAALAGTLWAGPHPGTTAGERGGLTSPATSPSGRWTTLGVLAWAVGLGVYSMWTLRPNPDDLFYVNLSQWVATHGQFPVKDTLFSELAYPMANWPPIASYDGLVGVVARLLGAHAASVEYAVPPIATFLAVLALWRLLRAWRVHHLLWVLSTALAFLLFDGTVSYASPGNLFLTRLWQGKIVLLCVVVPLLLVYALRYVERPTRARLAGSPWAASPPWGSPRPACSSSRCWRWPRWRRSSCATDAARWSGSSPWVATRWPPPCSRSPSAGGPPTTSARAGSTASTRRGSAIRSCSPTSSASWRCSPCCSVRCWCPTRPPA